MLVQRAPDLKDATEYAKQAWEVFTHCPKVQSRHAARRPFRPFAGASLEKIRRFSERVV